MGEPAGVGSVEPPQEAEQEPYRLPVVRQKCFYMFVLGSLFMKQALAKYNKCSKEVFKGCSKVSFYSYYYYSIVFQGPLVCRLRWAKSPPLPLIGRSVFEPALVG